MKNLGTELLSKTSDNIR